MEVSKRSAKIWAAHRECSAVLKISLVAGLVLATQTAWASCGDRPGTPTNVTAKLNWVRGHQPSAFVDWINTAGEGGDI
jgi:hypothetical protein